MKKKKSKVITMVEEELNLINKIKINAKATIEFEEMNDSEQKKIEEELRKMGYI